VYDELGRLVAVIDQSGAAEHTTSPTAFYGSRITWNGEGFDLKMKDGTVLVFGDNAPLQAIRDRFGNTITLVRTAGQTGNIDRILSPNGRWIALTYDAAQRITQATDNIGRTVTYEYASGRLWKVTDAAAGVTEYTYDTSDRMLTIKDARGITYLTNTYDSNGRVDTQTQADGGVFEFDYTLDASGKVTQTDMTDPRGFVQRTTFNSDGYHLAQTEALGTSLARTTTLVRQTGTQWVTSATDPLNRVTTYGYDTHGNVTSIVRLSGTTDAVTTTYTYEPAYQQLASVTDPLNHTTTYGYDYDGHLTTITDPLSHQTTFTYNSAGQPLTVTNALNKTVTFGYFGGDLVSVTSALGHVTRLFTDGAGPSGAGDGSGGPLGADHLRCPRPGDERDRRARRHDGVHLRRERQSADADRRAEQDDHLDLQQHGPGGDAHRPTDAAGVVHVRSERECAHLDRPQGTGHELHARRAEPADVRRVRHGEPAELREQRHDDVRCGRTRRQSSTPAPARSAGPTTSWTG
jgi:YD repeat-containing protein